MGSSLHTLYRKPKIYKNPKDYQVIKEKIVAQDKIKHFPKEIPANATEILMYGYQNTDFYGEEFLLSFKTYLLNDCVFYKQLFPNRLYKREYDC